MSRVVLYLKAPAPPSFKDKCTLAAHQSNFLGGSSHMLTYLIKSPTDHVECRISSTDTALCYCFDLNSLLSLYPPVNMDRLRQLAGQFTGNSTCGRDALFQKSPDDVVITMAIRTPLTKARKGGFKDTRYVCLVPIRVTIGHICMCRSDELVTSMFKVL